MKAKSINRNFSEMGRILSIGIIILGILLIDIHVINSQNTDNLINERNIRNAILGNAWFSEDDLEYFDLNNDEAINISDLIYYLSNKKNYISFVGEHIGTLWKDDSDYVEGQKKSFGQIPFCLRIDSYSPMQGYIVNLPESENDQANYYSLYFPKKNIPVTFLVPDESKDLKFEIQFTTTSQNLSPMSDLTRKMVFSGNFLNNSNMLSGGYEEHIFGFKDVYGEDIPISLNGKFILIFNDSNNEINK